MAKIEFKITGDWDKMAKALDPERFKANLEANLSRATSFNGMMVVGEIRRRIKAKKYASNAALTVLIKKSSTPLVNDGDLFGAITSQTIDAYSTFVGILRTASTGEGKPLTNLAELLHSGATIQVTEHMRNMFILLSEVGQGKREASELTGRAAEIAAALGPRIKQIKPLRPSTTHIAIPPRPFLTSVLYDPLIHKKCQKNWQKAVEAAFRDQASGSSSKGGGISSSSAKAAVPAKKGKPTKQPSNRSAAARKGWKTRQAKQAKKQGG